MVTLLASRQPSFVITMLTRLWFLSMAPVAFMGIASAQTENAIVKVVSTIGSKSYEGIGFVYQPPSSRTSYVVTALHVVAGSSSIEIQTAQERKLSNARIYKFYRNADLVLLEPATPLNIAPLQVHTGPVPSSGKIWSISRQRVAWNDMRLGREKPLFELFKREQGQGRSSSLQPMSPADIKKYFSPHYYPDSEVRVLELGKSIGPGDSGSPITYDDAVISMVDGGLHNLGGIRKAWWSIPLKKNLDMLWARGETDTRNLQAYSDQGGRILFSKPRGENPPVRYRKGDDAAAPFSLYHTDRVQFGDVYPAMLPEDRRFVKDIIQDDAALTVEMLFDEELDVYECYETGATFALPTILSDDLVIENIGGQTFVEAFSQFSGNSKSYVKLIVFIDGGGIEAQDLFEEYILSGAVLEGDDWGGHNWQGVTWGPDEASGDVVINNLDDPLDPFYHKIMERSYKQASNEGEVYASLSINGNGVFLGVAIIVNDPSSLEGDDLINYYLMEVCMTMAGFPYD